MTLRKVLFKNKKMTYTLESCLPAVIVFPPFPVNPKSNQKDINDHYCPSTYVQGLDLTLGQANEIYGIPPNEIQSEIQKNLSCLSR